MAKTRRQSIILLASDGSRLAVLKNARDCQFKRYSNGGVESGFRLPKADPNASNLAVATHYLHYHGRQLVSRMRILQRDAAGDSYQISGVGRLSDQRKSRLPANWSYTGLALSDAIQDVIHSFWSYKWCDPNEHWNAPGTLRSNVDTATMTSAVILAKDAKGQYFAEGHIEPPPVRVPDYVEDFVKLRFSEVEGQYVHVKVRARAGDTPDTDDPSWTPWTEFIATAGGGSINLPKRAYVQVHATLSTENTTANNAQGVPQGYTPVLNGIEIVGRHAGPFTVGSIATEPEIVLQDAEYGLADPLDALVDMCQKADWEFCISPEGAISVAPRIGTDRTNQCLFVDGPVEDYQPRQQASVSNVSMTGTPRFTASLLAKSFDGSNGKNVALNGGFDKFTDGYAPGWDTALNGTLKPTSGWAAGYNSSVPAPTTGYHAHLEAIGGANGGPCLVFPNRNSTYGNPQRLLFIQGYLTGSSMNLFPGAKLYVKLKVKVDTAGMGVYIGLNHYEKGATTFGASGYLYAKPSEVGEYQEFLLGPFLVDGKWELSKPISLNIYGSGASITVEGTAWVDDVQVLVSPFGKALMVEQAVTNMVTDGGFEVSIDSSKTSAWPNNDGTFLFERRNDRYGGYMAYFEKTNDLGNAGCLLHKTPVSPNTQYSMAVDAFVDSLGPSESQSLPYLREYRTSNTNGLNVAQLTYEDGTPVASWTELKGKGMVRLTGTVTTAADATHLAISTYLGSLGSRVYFDNVQLETGPCSTSFANGTRTAECLKLDMRKINPAKFCLELRLPITKSALRKVTNQYNRLFNIYRGKDNTYSGILIWHSYSTNNWVVELHDDAAGSKSAMFSDSLTPVGKVATIRLNVDKDNATVAVFVGVEGNWSEACRITGAVLPTSFSDLYLGCAGTSAYLNTSFEEVRVSNDINRADVPDWKAPLPVDPYTTLYAGFNGSLLIESGETISGTTQSLVARAKITVLRDDASELCNQLVCFGAGEDQAALQVTLDDAQSQSEHGIWTGIFDDKKAETLSDLRASGQKELDKRKNPKQALEVEVQYVPDGFPEFRAGDTVTIVARDPNNKLRGNFRIISEERSDNGEAERIRLEVDNFVGTLVDLIMRGQPAPAKPKEIVMPEKPVNVTSISVPGGISFEWAGTYDYVTIRHRTGDGVWSTLEPRLLANNYRHTNLLPLSSHEYEIRGVKNGMSSEAVTVAAKAGSFVEQMPGEVTHAVLQGDVLWTFQNSLLSSKGTAPIIETNVTFEEGHFGQAVYSRRIAPATQLAYLFPADTNGNAVALGSDWVLCGTAMPDKGSINPLPGPAVFGELWKDDQTTLSWGFDYTSSTKSFRVWEGSNPVTELTLPVEKLDPATAVFWCLANISAQCGVLEPGLHFWVSAKGELQHAIRTTPVSLPAYSRLYVGCRAVGGYELDGTIENVRLQSGGLSPDLAECVILWAKQKQPFVDPSGRYNFGTYSSLDSEGFHLRRRTEGPSGSVEEPDDMVFLGQRKDDDGPRLEIKDSQGLLVADANGIQRLGPRGITADQFAIRSDISSPETYIISGCELVSMKTQTLFADRDAWVSRNSTSKNYGQYPTAALRLETTTERYNYRTEETIYSYTGDRALIHFDHTALSGPVTSAKLQITTKNTVAGKIRVKELSAGFSESAVTWSNQPLVIEASVLEIPVTGAGVYTLEIAALVNAWVNGTKQNYGLQLSFDKTTAQQIALREYSPATDVPKLLVEYNASSTPGAVTVRSGRVQIARQIYDYPGGAIFQIPTDATHTCYLHYNSTDCTWTLNTTSGSDAVCVGTAVRSGGSIGTVDTCSASTGRKTGQYDFAAFWGNRMYFADYQIGLTQGAWYTVQHNLGTRFVQVHLWCRAPGDLEWSCPMAVDTSVNQWGITWRTEGFNTIKLQAGQENAFYTFDPSGAARKSTSVEIRVCVVRICN